MLKNQPVLGLSTVDAVNANDVRGLNVRNIIVPDNLSTSIVIYNDKKLAYKYRYKGVQ